MKIGIGVIKTVLKELRYKKRPLEKYLKKCEHCRMKDNCNSRQQLEACILAGIKKEISDIWYLLFFTIIGYLIMVLLSSIVQIILPNLWWVE